MNPAEGAIKVRAVEDSVQEYRVSLGVRSSTGLAEARMPL